MAAIARWRNADYLRWVAGRPCARCGRQGNTQAHHIRGIGHKSGVGLKAPDQWTAPLCVGCHHEFHADPWPGAAVDQYKWIAETLAAFVDEMADGYGSTLAAFTHWLARYRVDV